MRYQSFVTTAVRVDETLQNEILNPFDEHLRRRSQYFIKYIGASEIEMAFLYPL